MFKALITYIHSFGPPNPLNFGKSKQFAIIFFTGNDQALWWATRTRPSGVVLCYQCYHWSVLQVIPYHQSVDHNVYVAKIKRLKIRPKIRQLKLKIMQSAHYVVCDQTD